MVAATTKNELLFCLRSRNDGRLAEMAPGGIDGVLLFGEKRHALDFHREVVGHKSISRKQRRRGLREWQVSEFRQDKMLPHKQYWLAVPNDTGHDYVGLMPVKVRVQAA